MNDTKTMTPGDASGRTLFSNRVQSVLTGTSFKHEHLSAIQADELNDIFFEVHAENYMGSGGLPHRVLSMIAEQYPLSVHGVCMSIGGPEPLNLDHLGRFSEVIRRYHPLLVSEHLAWSSHGEAFYNDLLPLPYTKKTLQTVCSHIDQIQDKIHRPILLENPSTYIQFASSNMSETQFLDEVTHRTGCGILLDINNVYVSATNHGFSARDYLLNFPLSRVGEIHLAGHSEQRDDESNLLLIDSHDRVISDPVWALFIQVIEQFGPIPTLIEWDSNLPAWAVLKQQASVAHHLLSQQVRSRKNCADEMIKYA